MARRYRIKILPTALRELKAVPKPTQKLIRALINSLANDPRPAGSELLSGTGRERIYRVREGDWRVLYQVLDDEVRVSIVRIGHRGEVYTDAMMEQLKQRIKGHAERASATAQFHHPPELTRRAGHADSYFGAIRTRRKGLVGRGGGIHRPGPGTAAAPLLHQVVSWHGVTTSIALCSLPPVTASRRTEGKALCGNTTGTRSARGRSRYGRVTPNSDVGPRQYLRQRR